MNSMIWPPRSATLTFDPVEPVQDLDKGKAGLGSLTGVVITGDQRGRTLGFPTANIDLGNESKKLRQGVYAVWVMLDGRLLPGVAAYGKPMFDNHQPPLETHIFDFSADIYGRQITVHLVCYLRDCKVFSGLEELVAAMNADACRAREILRSPHEAHVVAIGRVVDDAAGDGQWR